MIMDVDKDSGQADSHLVRSTVDNNGKEGEDRSALHHHCIRVIM